jgi:hypothetical protein
MEGIGSRHEGRREMPQIRHIHRYPLSLQVKAGTLLKVRQRPPEVAPLELAFQEAHNSFLEVAQKFLPF